MPSKQSTRRHLSKLRAEYYRTPWAIDARTLGSIEEAIQSGELEEVQATLSSGTDEESTARTIDGVAVIPITGVLRDEVDYMVEWGGASSYQLIERDFLNAINDPQVKAILFYHNSPGGSAIGCKRVADVIFENRGTKPVVSYVQGICGSADFYIASATDRIDSVADAMVASVGTIYPHMEQSKMLEEWGIKARVFTNTDSPKKGHGNTYEPLTDAAEETIQTFVDSYGRAFIEDVARYRDITPEDVIAKYGQGDAMRADIAIKDGVVDRIVRGFTETLATLTSSAGSSPTTKSTPSPVVSGITLVRSGTMNERIKAQLFAMGLVSSIDASDADCKIALNAWLKAQGKSTPDDEKEILAVLQAGIRSEESGDDDEEDAEDEGDDDDEVEDKEEEGSSNVSQRKTNKLQQTHNTEQGEARLADLRAARDLVNSASGSDAVTAEMVLDAHENKLGPKAAMKSWSKKLASRESNVDAIRITGEGADRYASDVIDALVYRAGGSTDKPLSKSAEDHVRKPLWAVAAESLRHSGRSDIDAYGSRELLAEQAMQMGTPGQRHTFYSSNEGRQYVQAAGGPATRPGDFPNILSGLANKYLDSIELDDDYSYDQISAVMPGGLSDFKPGLMVNRGVVEELDEIQDADQLKELGMSEEVLSYLFLRRFGNKFGWTPVLVANDDLSAFAEGMIGLAEAWQVTQNRQVVDLLTGNPALLDGNPLFSDRANTGTGANPALNNNLVGSGGVPSDAAWSAMETQYADIGGIETGRRVRGSLNMAFCPTGTVAQAARRTFLPLNTGGMEMKVATTTDNVGLYRGEVQVATESELRVADATAWYGLRNPTRLNTATLVRGYFNGFGTGGRRERWYDPERKTTWVSLEGRMAAAVKNWRYAVKNNGQ